jgi:CO/xanthine dehydrogenase Mo-binding subunit
MALPELNVIGKAGNHDQLAKHVLTGHLDFAGDRLPGRKLYGAIKSSTIAHGEIDTIDISKAMAEPGVKAVITYNECPAFSKSIFQWGQEVAGVVADDWYTAIRACSLVEVTYKDAVAVTDPDEAMKTGAPLTGIRPDTNVNKATDLTRGDVNAGFQAADVTVETTQPWTSTWQHNCLETHQSVSWWVGEDCYIWGPSQNTFSAHSAVVNALGIPANRVHFFSHGTGTALGDKTGNPTGTPAAVMSKAVGGQPVHLIETRHDNMLFNTRMFAVRSSIKLGAKKDGTITAVDATFWADGGRNANAPAGNAAFGLKNTFKIPNASFKVNIVSTNSPARGYYRCVQDPPAAVNYDTALDKLANQLGMDPYQLRMKNFLEPDAPDQDEPFRQWGNGGAGVGVKMCFEKAYQESGYAQKWHQPGQKTLSDGRLHGIAITGHLDGHGSVGGGSRAGMLTITADGKALVNMGGSRATSGAPTTMCHFVAEALGMTYEDVRLGEWGNTDVSLSAGGQNGSGFTGGAGSAFVNAARDARAKIFAAAITKTGLKDIQGITVDDLDAKNSEIFYTKDPTKKITFRQAMSGTAPIMGFSCGWNSTSSGQGQGLQRTREGLPPIGTAVNANGGCACCAEIAVDTDTGEVEVLGLWNCIDTGRTINREGATKEMYSGAELIYTEALIYGDIYDPTTGACISSNYTESMLPTFKDVPTHAMHVFDIESDDYGGPYGAHGIGEPCNSNYSSILCAFFNATGKWLDPDKGPCTPNKVLKALGKA